MPDISDISQLAPLGRSKDQSSLLPRAFRKRTSAVTQMFTVNSERLTTCVGFQAFVMDEYLCFSGAVVKQKESNPIWSPSLKKVIFFSFFFKGGKIGWRGAPGNVFNKTLNKQCFVLFV